MTGEVGANILKLRKCLVNITAVCKDLNNRIGRNTVGFTGPRKKEIMESFNFGKHSRTNENASDESDIIDADIWNGNRASFEELPCQVWIGRVVE